MTPMDEWLAKLEQTLEALGIETGYPAEAMKAAQEQFISSLTNEQEKKDEK